MKRRHFLSLLVAGKKGKKRKKKRMFVFLAFPQRGKEKGRKAGDALGLGCLFSVLSRGGKGELDDSSFPTSSTILPGRGGGGREGGENRPVS